MISSRYNLGRGSMLPYDNGCVPLRLALVTMSELHGEDLVTSGRVERALAGCGTIANRDPSLSSTIHGCRRARLDVARKALGNDIQSPEAALTEGCFRLPVTCIQYSNQHDPYREGGAGSLCLT